MRRIKLTQGKFATVDDELYDQLVAMGPWRFHKGYAYRGWNAMHRVVFELLGEPVPPQVDHRNRRKRDNRRKNLRPANHSQNKANEGLRRDNTSGFRGVRWNEEKQRWQARISTKGKETHLGYFDNARDAAAVYDEAALALWGEFARLNFPKPRKRACDIKRAAASRLRRNNTSGYYGVSWHKTTRKWQAYLCYGGQTKHIGRYPTKMAAAKARDKAALEHFGPNVILNFPLKVAA